MANNNDLEIKIGQICESTKQAHHRLDKIEKTIEVIYSLAGDVKVLANELVSLREDVNDIKRKQDSKDNEPNKILFNVKSTVFCGIIMMIISAIMTLILR